MPASSSQGWEQKPAPYGFVLKTAEEVVAPLVEKLNELEDRIEQLEAGGIKYCGTWQRAQDYRRGDTCTHAGSLWVALKEAPSGREPGSDAAFWQLAVKRGRDGKDAR